LPVINSLSNIEEGRLRSDDGSVAFANIEGRGRRQRVPKRTAEQRLANGEIDLEEATELARGSALRILTAAPKSRAELQISLLRKGHAPAVVEPLLDRLEEVGLLDDEAYAAQVLRTRFVERGHSRRALSQELSRRGITNDIAQNVLAEISDDDERLAAKHLAAKLAQRGTELPPDVRLRRLVAALARRGYEPSLAYEAARSIIVANDIE